MAFDTTKLVNFDADTVANLTIRQRVLCAKPRTKNRPRRRLIRP